MFVSDISIHKNTVLKKSVNEKLLIENDYTIEIQKTCILRNS